MLRRVLTAPVWCAVGLALVAIGSNLAMRWSQPSLETSGLHLHVEAWRGSGWSTISTSRGSLPLQRDLGRIRASMAATEFRATWSGTLLAERNGLHLFSVSSDDGARVWIDGTLVLDNGGRHMRLWRSGAVDLTAGPHAVRVEYEQWGGDAHLETWLQQPGGLSRRLDALRRQFAPGEMPTGERMRRTLRGWLPWVAAGTASGSYLALLTVIGVAIFRCVERRAGVPPVGWSLAGILLLASLPIAAGLSWGLPSDADGWAPDELVPTRVLAAIERGFEAPWTSVYPPLHFYVLTPVVLVIEAASRVDGWSAGAYPGAFVTHAAMRAVSVLMATGVLAWLYLLVRIHGTAAEGRAAIVAATCCSTLIYYGKTANVDVPYLYWTLCACTCVAATARTWRPSLVLLAAVAGACAVGTKDQAAGFLILLPVWLLVIRRRGDASVGTTPWSDVLRDPVWLQAAGAVILTLAAIYLWPWDWTAVSRHVEAARRATYAPMVPGTIGGQVRLLVIELELLVFMAGVPLALLMGLGIGWAPRHRPALGLAVGVPIASYVFIFLPVIRYTYDRFLLGVALLLACLAGPCGLWLWQHKQWRGILAAGGALAVAYTLCYALTANVLMARDSRFEAEVALRERASQRRELVGLLSPRTYLPRVDILPVVELQVSQVDLETWSPDVLLLDRAWMGRFRPADREGFELRQALDANRLPYRKTQTWHAPAPWFAFQARDWYLARYSRLGLTNLDKINPSLELWARRAPQRPFASTPVSR